MMYHYDYSAFFPQRIFTITQYDRTILEKTLRFFNNFFLKLSNCKENSPRKAYMRLYMKYSKFKHLIDQQINFKSIIKILNNFHVMFSNKCVIRNEKHEIYLLFILKDNKCLLTLSADQWKEFYIRAFYGTTRQKSKIKILEYLEISFFGRKWLSVRPL
jgi:hypothetical protein